MTKTIGRFRMFNLAGLGEAVDGCSPPPPGTCARCLGVVDEFPGHLECRDCEGMGDLETREILARHHFESTRLAPGDSCVAGTPMVGGKRLITPEVSDLLREMGTGDHRAVYRLGDYLRENALPLARAVSNIIGEYESILADINAQDEAEWAADGRKALASLHASGSFDLKSEYVKELSGTFRECVLQRLPKKILDTFGPVTTEKPQ